MTAPPETDAALDPALLLAALDQLPAALSLKDAERRYVLVNRLWEAYHGVPRAAVLGRRFEELDSATIDAASLQRLGHEVRQRDAAILAGGRPSSDVEEGFAGADGVARTLLSNKVRLAQDGRAAGILSLTLDITERKRVEAELRAVTGQLAERGVALAAAQERAERARDAAAAASRAKSRFLALVSHELLTPMTGVLGMADILESATSDGAQREALGTLRASAEALLRVLEGVLDYARLEGGATPGGEGELDPAALLDEVAALFGSGAAARGLRLVVERGPGLPARVRSEPDRLLQVLSHLLSNALKFTEQGEVRLGCALAPGAEGEPALSFSVSDTGPGIPPDKRPALFQPFAPLGEVTSRRTGGMGLGLAVCKEMVEAMGGRIWCEEAPGGGAAFRFTVPLSAAPERIPAAPAAPVAPTRAARVLMVDDVALNRRVVASILGREGHAVTAVASGEAALEAVRRAPFDIVLMDLHMPGLDGMAATRAIRRLPGAPGRLPIHALTADVFASTTPEFRAAGFDGFLTKPLDWPAIRRAVADALAAADAPPDESAGVLDAARVAAVFDGLPPETVEGMFEEFLGAVRSQVEGILALRGRGSAAELRTDLHALKGLAANFGAARLAQVAGAMQARLDSGAVLPPAAFDELDAALLATEQAIGAGQHHAGPAGRPAPGRG